MNCTAFSKGASASGSQYYREFLMYCITRLSVCIGECKQTASTDDKALETFKLLRGENVILLWYVVTKLLMEAGTTFFRWILFEYQILIARYSFFKWVKIMYEFFFMGAKQLPQNSWTCTNGTLQFEQLWKSHLKILVLSRYNSEK